MAHAKTQTAIFSPSVARAAASTAKDWSYIDRWLRVKYGGQSIPQFERNADTLKALLALASHNETADEERELMARMEIAALEEVKAAQNDKIPQQDGTGNAPSTTSLDGALIADNILHALESGLTKDGHAALDSIACMAVELGVAYPTPDELGIKFVELQERAYDLEQSLERVALLQKYLDRETVTVNDFIRDLRGVEYTTPTDMGSQTTTLQRQVKDIAASLPELSQRLTSLKATTSLPDMTVEEVKQDETAYLDLLAKKKDLDAQVKAFAGLPPDVDAARAELETLRAELRHATQRRDAQFEGLVERESPFKPRRRQ